VSTISGEDHFVGAAASVVAPDPNDIRNRALISNLITKIVDIKNSFERFRSLSLFLDEHERLAFHSELGWAYERLGRGKEAIEQYKTVVDLIEHQRAGIDSSSDRATFLTDKEKVYSRLIPLLRDAGDSAQVFDYMERARSRSFVDMLASGRPTFHTKAESGQYMSAMRDQAEIELITESNHLPLELGKEALRALRGVKVQGGPGKGNRTGYPNVSGVRF
jgi:hypothetical protein